MRLIAVILMGLLVAYWFIYAVYLLFLPDGAPGATIGVLWGAICLAIGAVVALVTWATAKRKWAAHIIAIVIAALGVLPGILAMLSRGTWDVWVYAGISVVALVLLLLTIPRAEKKPENKTAKKK